MPPNRAKMPRFRLRPVHIALIYIAVSVTWILVSDKIVRLVEGAAVYGVPAQTIKGIGFVVASGVLLYFLTKSATGQAEQAGVRAGESELRFRRMAANIPGAIFRYILYPDGTDRVEYMSPGCEDIWEIDAATIQRSVKVLWEAIDPEHLEAMRVSVETSAQRGEPWSHEWRITTPSGSKKWLQGYGQPNASPSGEIIWDSVIFDVTQKKTAEEATIRMGRRLEHILQNINEGFFLADHEWRYTTINHAGAAMVGLTPERMLGRTMLEVFPEVKGTIWEETYARVMRTGKPESIEARYEPLNSWFDARIDATDDGVAVFFRDISERKRAEQRQQLMMRELDHRVKNNLAAVLAISESSLREADSLAEFAEAFTGRIRAMASMHSLLAAQRWEGVGFVNLIHAVVGPYTDRDGSRLQLSGPDLRLPSNAAPAICMTLHELATNAVKHGALAKDHGRLQLEWEFDEATHDLRIRWSERDGPSVAATVQPGFGMDLLKGVIPYELNGDINLEFTPQGLEVTIIIPGGSLRDASTLPLVRTEAAK